MSFSPVAFAYITYTLFVHDAHLAASTSPLGRALRQALGAAVSGGSSAAREEMRMLGSVVEEVLLRCVRPEVAVLEWMGWKFSIKLSRYVIAILVPVSMIHAM